jgi:hypothetical protein
MPALSAKRATSPPVRRLEPIAPPWAWEHLQDLIRLRNYARQIGKRRIDGLMRMGMEMRANPYSSAEAARRDLRVHPIYRWLAQNLSDVLRHVPENDPCAEIEFVSMLARSLAFGHIEASIPRNKDREDKRRKGARAAIARIERDIAQGTVWLAQNQLDMLEQLLNEAKATLGERRRKPPKYPSLFGLARDLRGLKLAKTATLEAIMAVATANDLQCDERTARRYIQEARKA